MCRFMLSDGKVRMRDKKLLLYREQNKLLALRIAGGRLYAIQVYDEAETVLKGDIYVGKVSRIMHNINAAFVEVQNGYNCFLSFEKPLKAVHLLNRTYDGRLVAGDELIVQVSKEAVKTKPPVVSTEITFSGRYLAIADGMGKLRFSGKLSHDKKQEITAFLKEKGYIDQKHFVRFPKKESQDSDDGAPLKWDIIVRTNSRSLTDFSSLQKEWTWLYEEMQRLLTASLHRTCFSCLQKTQQPYLADIKNHYEEDIDEILTDCEDIYQTIQQYVEEQRKQNDIILPPVRFYEDTYPLYKLYQTEKLLGEALDSRVWLKSGAYLIIEPTEAMTVIDVNTGKCIKKGQSENTFFSINVEAAEEIALQLKLRNLSGIIIVDFINMDTPEKKEALLERLRVLTAMDSVKTEVVDITPLGLVEITRQRINRPIRELFQKKKEGGFRCL